jgi:hypothetical protein
MENVWLHLGVAGFKALDRKAGCDKCRQTRHNRHQNNLLTDLDDTIHTNLHKRGMKGCIAGDQTKCTLTYCRTAFRTCKESREEESRARKLKKSNKLHSYFLSTNSSLFSRGKYLINPVLYNEIAGVQYFTLGLANRGGFDESAWVV